MWYRISRSALWILVLCVAVATVEPPTGGGVAGRRTAIVHRFRDLQPIAVRVPDEVVRAACRLSCLQVDLSVADGYADECNNTVKADLYLPDGMKPGDAKRPAAITLHVLNGDTRVNDLACSLLALRGLPAVMLWLPYYGPRAKPEGWDVLMHDPKLFLGMLQQSIVDVRRTVDILASRPEVDSQRIDLTGFSLGGIVSANAAASEPRIFRTCMFLAGSDLLDYPAILRGTRGD